MTLLPFFPDDVADADALYDSFSAWAQRDGLVKKICETVQVPRPRKRASS